MLGLMRSKTHREIYVKQAEAYRWEIDQAQAEARAARGQLKNFLDDLAPGIYLDKGFGPECGLRIFIELEERLLDGVHNQELVMLLHGRLMDRILSINDLRDSRPDLRDPSPKFYLDRPALPVSR